MKEKFKQMREYPNYLISNFGRIYSFKSNRFIQQRVNGRYLRCSLYCRGGISNTNVLIHRLVAKYFVFKPNGCNVVNHIDGNRMNNNYTNLEWCTQKQNVIHACKNGLIKRNFGSDVAGSKLTKDQVMQIVNLKGRFNGLEVANMFKVSRTTIFDIWSGRKYSCYTNIEIQNSKTLTKNMVIKIKEMLNKNIGRKEIREITGVNLCIIGKIARGERWRSI